MAVGITLAIPFVVEDADKSVRIRIIDDIEPEILKEIEYAPVHVAGVKAVQVVSARRLEHRVYTDVVIDSEPEMTVRETDKLAKNIDQSQTDSIRMLGNALARIQPAAEMSDKCCMLTLILQLIDKTV